MQAGRGLVAARPECGKVTAVSQPCTSCGWECTWESGDEDWAACPNCDLPVKHFAMPAPPRAWRATTLRLIADHFYPETPEKKVIISPSHKMREEWAIFLRDEADRLEE